MYPYVDVLELHDEICGSANPLIAEMNSLKEKVIPLYDNMLFYKVRRGEAITMTIRTHLSRGQVR